MTASKEATEIPEPKKAASFQLIRRTKNSDAIAINVKVKLKIAMISPSWDPLKVKASAMEPIIIGIVLEIIAPTPERRPTAIYTDVRSMGCLVDTAEVIIKAAVCYAGEHRSC